MKYLVLAASEHDEGETLESVLTRVDHLAAARGQRATVLNILPIGKDHGGNLHYRVIVHADDAFEMQEPEPQA